MSRFADTFRAHFSAVAFAEAGEHDTALRMVQDIPTSYRAKGAVLDGLRRTFAAVAFAEEGLHEEARAMLSPTVVSVRKTWCAEESFLDLVGLQHVRVRHMVLEV